MKEGMLTKFGEVYFTVLKFPFGRIGKRCKDNIKANVR
jgi:hypothetical protein